MSEAKDTTVVTVTSKGQATIPKRFRDKLHIETPGRVRFIETESGDVIIRPVKRPSEVMGELASGESGEQSATELLREERERDKQEDEERFFGSEE